MTELPMGSPDDAAAPGAAVNAGTIRDPIPLDELGSVTLTPDGDFEAGSYASFTLTYTAGKFGIDDCGVAADLLPLRLRPEQAAIRGPESAELHDVEASNSAVLDYRFDQKATCGPGTARSTSRS